jgi:hypothetical protein
MKVNVDLASFHIKHTHTCTHTVQHHPKLHDLTFSYTGMERLFTPEGMLLSSYNLDEPARELLSIFVCVPVAVLRSLFPPFASFSQMSHYKMMQGCERSY